MSTGTQRQQPQTQTTNVDSLLEQVLKQGVGQRVLEIREALETRIDKIRELLPTHLKDEAERLAKRAIFTFSRKKELQECTPGSFIRCVLEAAEIGLAIDGRLCHAVPYNVKVSAKGERDRWEKHSQCIPDYKGLIAIARRSGQIENVKADIVCANDVFTHGRAGPISRLEHSYALGQDRGDVIGAYAVISFPDDTPWVYELMDIADLDHIMNKSKAKDNGPWVTDKQEMRKKTVVRRGLKTYCDDPGLIRAFEIDDAEIDGIRVSAGSGDGKRVHRSSLNESLSVPTAAPKAASKFAEQAAQQGQPKQDDPENRDEDFDANGEHKDNHTDQATEVVDPDAELREHAAKSEALDALHDEFNETSSQTAVNAILSREIGSGRWTPDELAKIDAWAQAAIAAIKGRRGAGSNKQQELVK